MDRDDEQLLRHSTRELAEFLAIFYRELRVAGLPKSVAKKLTVAQWHQLLASGQTEALKSMIENMKTPDEDD